MAVDESPARLTAVRQLARMRSGALSPVDLTEACIARIERLNPRINAVAATCFDRAREEAQASAARHAAGTPCGPLDGLTLGVKDLQPTEGVLTTSGSPLFRDHVPGADLPMVARLRAAGAIVLGKTNVPEFGAGGNSRNPVWGATGNPFDASLNAGGSSGGSAAALAADFFSLCTGSDTGGSLRLPAALCGVTGFRPSPGLVAHPTRPLGWSGISVLGPMARDMTDLTLMLGVIVGADADDPLSAPPPAGLDAPGADLSRLRIGIAEDFGGCPVEDGIRATFRARVDAIRGHVASTRPLALELGAMDRCFDILRAESFTAAFAALHAAGPGRFGPDIADNLALAATLTFADRAWAHAEQTRILRAWNAATAEVDVVLAPTSPVSPFPWTTRSAAAVAGVPMDTYYRWLALTYRGTLTGAPALTLPAGLDHAGMPFGLQVLGRTGGDAALLSAGRALEALLARDPATARPRADLEALTPSSPDLKSIVTHPPASSGHRGAPAPLTAV